jgi:hypothetical protein
MMVAGSRGLGAIDPIAPRIGQSLQTGLCVRRLVSMVVEQADDWQEHYPDVAVRRVVARD